MAGNTASLTFRLFGVDVNARQTISNVGVASAGTAKQLEMLSTGTLKFVAGAGAASIAAVGLAGAVGLGLGAAFAGAGVAVAAMSKNVQKEFKDLGTGIKKDLVELSTPVQDSLGQLAKYIGESFKTMRPVLQGVFKDIAPLVTTFGQGLVKAVANVVTEFQPFIREVLPIVRTFFAQIPDLVGNLANALHSIVDPLAGNSKAFGQLIQTIGSLLPIVGSTIGSLVRLGQTIMPVFQQSILAVGTALDSGLMKVLPLVGKAVQTMLPPLVSLIATLARAAAQILPVLIPVLSKVVVTLAEAAEKVLPQILPSLVQLIKAFAQLLPALTPLIPPILYLLKSVSNLVPPLAELAGKILGALAPAFSMLVPLLVQVSGQVGEAFAKAFQQAAPSLIKLAQAAGQILIALTPLIPVVVQAALAFLPLVPAVAGIAAALAQGLVPIVQTITPLLIMLAPTLVKVAIAAKLWSIAQGILNVVLAANPIGIVIIALAALAAGLVFAWKHSETFRDVVKGVFNAIRGAVGTAVNWIIDRFLDWFNAASDVVLGILHMFGKLPGPMGAPFRAAESAVRSARGTVNLELNRIQDKVNRLTGKNIPISARDHASPVIDGILHKLMHLPGNVTVGITGIARPGGPVAFATGGILTEPILGVGLRSGTQYTLGESGPEAVVPLGAGSGGRGPAGMAGAAPVHVHFHGPVYGDKRALAGVVRSAVRDAQRHDGIPAAQQLR